MSDPDRLIALAIKAIGDMIRARDLTKRQRAMWRAEAALKRLKKLAAGGGQESSNLFASRESRWDKPAGPTETTKQ